MLDEMLQKAKAMFLLLYLNTCKRIKFLVDGKFKKLHKGLGNPKIWYVF